MNAKIKQYNSLDLMKFISAILIIVLHTSPFQSYNALISFGLRNVVTIIAVPFFFCTSGFLLFKKLSVLSQDEKGKYFKHYIKRLCIMYGLWSLVYFSVCNLQLDKGRIFRYVRASIYQTLFL